MKINVPDAAWLAIEEAIDATCDERGVTQLGGHVVAGIIVDAAADLLVASAARERAAFYREQIEQQRDDLNSTEIALTHVRAAAFDAWADELEVEG